MLLRAGGFESTIGIFFCDFARKMPTKLRIRFWLMKARASTLLGSRAKESPRRANPTGASMGKHSHEATNLLNRQALSVLFTSQLAGICTHRWAYRSRSGRRSSLHSPRGGGAALRDQEVGHRSVRAGFGGSVPCSTEPPPWLSPFGVAASLCLYRFSHNGLESNFPCRAHKGRGETASPFTQCIHATFAPAL
jgi:hypothetical protein